MKFAKFLRTPILKNICERPTASLICNIAYEFSITLSFSSILRISTVNSEFSIKIQTMSPVLNATTGTVHAQRSYLTVAPLTYVEWRSGLKRCYTERFVWYDLWTLTQFYWVRDSYSALKFVWYDFQKIGWVVFLQDLIWYEEIIKPNRL